MAIIHIYLADSEIKDLISGKPIELRIRNGIRGGTNRIFINRENNEEFDIDKEKIDENR